MLTLDDVAALHAAEVKASLTGSRDHADAIDCMIAGIVIANGAKLASRNAQHFPRERFEILDPWMADTSG